MAAGGRRVSVDNRGERKIAEPLQAPEISETFHQAGRQEHDASPSPRKLGHLGLIDVRHGSGEQPADASAAIEAYLEHQRAVFHEDRELSEMRLSDPKAVRAVADAMVAGRGL